MLSHLSPQAATAAIIRMCLLAAVLTQLAGAHMVMSEPPPINYKTNPNYNPSKGDSDYTAPLSPSGSNYPCRGHLKDLNTPQGAAVRDYSPGGTYPIRIDGSAVHGGGSCQASLSYDSGASWTVIKSWIGNCPNAAGGAQAFSFTVPSSAPRGTAVFAWTWFNKIGNREMYMNCAVVNIGGGGSRKVKARQLGGPSLFVANVGNGCKTTEGTDVVFPNAGSEVEYGSGASAAPPSGTCDGQTFAGGAATGGNIYSGGGGTTNGEESSPQPGDTAAPAGPQGGNNGFYTPVAGTPNGGPATAPPYPYPTTGGGYDTGSGTGFGGGGGAEGCDYWEQQGYICSSGVRVGVTRLLAVAGAVTVVALWAL